MLKGVINIRVAAAFLIIAAAIVAIFLVYNIPMQHAKEWKAKGDAAFAEGKLDTAIYAYMRGAKEFPKLEGLNLCLGKALLMDGRGDDAIDALNRDVKENEDSVEGHLLLGYLHLMSVAGDDPFGTYVAGKFPVVIGLPGIAGKKPEITSKADHPLTEALYHFKYAEDISPHELAAAAGLAVMEGFRGDYTKANERLEEILERDPGNAFALDTLEQISYVAAASLFSGSPVGASPPALYAEGFTPPGTTLPPINAEWKEGEAEDNSGNDGPTSSGPPDITQEGIWEPSDYDDAGTPGTEPQHGTTVTPEGEIILTPESFRRQPRTRPIGAIDHIPGEPPIPFVIVGNRFTSGYKKLSVGQTAELPRSLIEVELLEVDGNKVTLLESGVKYTWIRGKVEWVLQPEEKGKLNADEEDEDSGKDEPEE